MSRTATLTLAATLALAVPAHVAAQSQTGIDAVGFAPAPARLSNYWELHQARLTDAWSVGVVFVHADSPLVLRTASGGRASELVSHRTMAHVLAAFSAGDRFELGLDLPVVLSQAGESPAGFPELDASDAGAGLADVRVLTKFMLFGPDEGQSGVALALMADWVLPTAGSADFRGEGFRVAPRVAFDGVLGGGSRIGVNVGAVIREDLELPNLSVGDALTYGAAAAIRVGAQGRGELIPEVRGASVLGATDFRSEEAPLEWMLGGRFRGDRGVGVEAAVGSGLVNGFGVADWRALFGLSISASVTSDRDNDGWFDHEDACPDLAEDLDTWRDDDGCPDPDNDGDGVLDIVDRCPLDAEDLDGYIDEDGCPDFDNDGDGVLDGYDACPLQPEDFDGDTDQDGCPEADVPVDSDGDGLLDPADGCPTMPEDFDGFEDHDGCPDPDNDRDGLPDNADACPNRPEDFDGDRDDDGCPEGTVVTCETIEIEEQVLFETNSDVIQSVSFGLLDEVSALVLATPEIRLIEVEGHTDGQGDDDYNLDLSERRAASVVDYMIHVGVSPDRLTWRGYGESLPVDTNDTADGRANNRRVVFRILDADALCD